MNPVLIIVAIHTVQYIHTIDLHNYITHFIFQPEGKTPQAQAGPEDSCRKSLAEHHQGRNQASVILCP